LVHKTLITGQVLVVFLEVLVLVVVGMEHTECGLDSQEEITLFQDKVILVDILEVLVAKGMVLVVAVAEAALLMLVMLEPLQGLLGQEEMEEMDVPILLQGPLEFMVVVEVHNLDTTLTVQIMALQLMELKVAVALAVVVMVKNMLTIILLQMLVLMDLAVAVVELRILPQVGMVLQEELEH
jgi:hypothetical protein